MTRQIRGKRVGFSIHVDCVNTEPPEAPPLRKHGGRAKVAGKRVTGTWSLRLPETSSFAPARFLKHIGAEVVRVLRAVGSSSKMSSSSLSLARSQSWSCAHQIHESHRAEAIEDCIEFLNASSSLNRSNSVSSTSC